MPALSVDDLAGRLASARERIEGATARAGRTPGSVRLLAVSKGQPASAIRAAYAAGARELGESYAQELEQKAAELADLPGLRWHAIGRLQRNKAKVIARLASVVHAVDGPELALELGKRAEAAGRALSVLVEVNVSGEASKGGCRPAALAEVLEAVARCSSLRAVGLMTLAPQADEPALAAPFFRALRVLRDGHGGPAALPELSMGMSHDFEVAIAEGATLVRLGTVIFGPR